MRAICRFVSLLNGSSGAPKMTSVIFLVPGTRFLPRAPVDRYMTALELRGSVAAGIVHPVQARKRVLAGGGACDLHHAAGGGSASQALGWTRFRGGSKWRRTRRGLQQVRPRRTLLSSR